MKKTRLLTSIAALALILGLGACNTSDEESNNPKNDEETNSSEDNSGESSGSTSSDDGRVTIENLTLNITFLTAEGEPTALPKHTTGYIVGDWDNWSNFLPLTEVNDETDGIYYTYTFETIYEGTYSFRGVMWYFDETISWDNYVEIFVSSSKDYETLEVTEELGSNAKIYFRENLTGEIPDRINPDLDNVENLLGVASQVQYGDGLNFDAYHYYEIEDDETNEYYMTTINDQTYGKWSITSGDGLVTTSYIEDGEKYTCYEYYDNWDDRYTKASWSESYTYPIEEFLEPFEEASKLFESELDLYDYDYEFITKTETTGSRPWLEQTTIVGYTFTITDGNETYLYDTDETYRITKVEYVNDNGTYKLLEELNENDVVAQMVSFVSVDWLDDLTIAKAIIEEVSKYEHSSDVFSSFHLSALDSENNQTDDGYITIDDEDNLYGVWNTTDLSSSVVATKYYDGGYAYNLTTNVSGEKTLGSYGPDSSTSIDELLANYNNPLENVINVNDLECSDFILTRTSTDFTLYVSLDASSYLTYTVNKNFELTAISYYESDEYFYSLETITSNEISEAMSDFNKYLWAAPTSPEELIDEIHITGSYAISIEYTQYLSEELTYGDYYTGNYDKDSLVETFTIYSSYLCDIYYTEDALLFEEYYYYSDIEDYSFVQNILLVNSPDDPYYGFDVMYEYMERVEGKWDLYAGYYGSWQDYYGSLFDEGGRYSFSASNFTYSGEGVDQDENAYTIWDLSSSSGRQLFTLLGSDWLFSTPSYVSIASCYIDTHFYESLQQMCITYWYDGWTYYTYPTSDDDIVYYTQIYFNAFVYDVGETDLTEIVEMVTSDDD